MTESASRAAHAAPDLGSTAENLQEELVRLEIQKQALQRELAAVAAHLGSVRQTLDTLRDLMAAGPSPAARGTAAEPSPRREPASGTAAAEGRAGVGERRTYGRLTNRIMEYFAGAGDVDVRARDVAAALGRDTDSGSINAVRSTLDRLVGASRLRRTGRGLYRAGTS